ncbi:hypothetical protein [Nonomuraea gerenzanensis]|uniref:Uncharacterized protein n=1 Tax=Nonomuraea gerenzanensis TaxID=93944 RepID=A0A1M4ECJ2_9ACTN|nr:hypothetical protein [Nonomuraea gerenzanensis]UBU18671.1 hypothetical protein LCN96_27750 [Nonomuraea gerenzanensis]SBO96530.1 hypothetical protein BN4615_P6046 [Nonomuraea gerenzanensis]
MNALVLHPDLPEAHRRAMAAHPDLLPPPPRRPAWGGRTAGDVLAALALSALCGFVPLLPALARRDRRPLLVAAAALLQAALLGVWIGYGFAAFFACGLAVQAVAAVTLLALAGESPVAGYGRRHSGRYVHARMLEPLDAALLERTVDATATVLGSPLDRDGLLDSVANRVTLPRQAWEIAETLTELTRLRREQDAARTGRVTERISTVLASQQEALTVATRALARRISALEEYARRTEEAQAVYAEWQTLQDLAEDDDAYRELLSRTARDPLAAEEVGLLSERARHLQESLRDSVEQARLAGSDLLSRKA